MINVNGIILNITTFSDKTTQVWKLTNLKNSLHVVWDFENESEIIHLAQLKDLADASGIDFSTLLISYLPYARQDKEVSNETTFALRFEKTNFKRF